MQQIKINKLMPHPRNDEFFDDITGEKWDEFLLSVKTRGVIEPIVITPDRVIVSGHQRVRACKELGIKTIMCDVHTYDNEDQILQDLIETNVRQRGNVGGSVRKIARRIIELERLYGVRNGSAGGTGVNQYTKELEPNNSVEAPTQEDLATKLGMSVDTLQNYKKLIDMIPELEDLVDTGIVAPTTALALMKNLTEEEQIELLSSLEATKKLTKKEADKYINEIKQLRAENDSLRDAEKSLEFERIKRENMCLENKNKILENQLKTINEHVEFYKTESEEYIKVKERLMHMGLNEDDNYHIFNAAVQITEMDAEIRKFVQERLAPFKYKDSIYAVRNSPLFRDDILNTLSMIHDWYLSMLSYLGEEYNEEIINMNTEELQWDCSEKNEIMMLT